MLEAWGGVGCLAGSARTGEDWKLVEDWLAETETGDGRPLAVLTMRRLAGGRRAGGEGPAQVSHCAAGGLERSRRPG